MVSSSLDTLLKVSKTTYPQKLFAYDCVTLYVSCRTNKSVAVGEGTWLLISLAFDVKMQNVKI